MGDLPCSPNGNMCCPQDWTCDSNGICNSPGNGMHADQTCINKKILNFRSCVTLVGTIWTLKDPRKETDIG